MNKTIIININGIVFHIEEDAYEILKNYMTDVKRHFSNSADSLEITTDIENRIAEMFAELLEKDHKQVIVEQDVTLIVEQMGSVADFENAENDSKMADQPYSYTTEGRRLFRDPDDHLIAGVCSGIANYFDIDPVWIRLAFAIFTPIGGTGFLLYIILWIVVPKAASRADRMAMKGEKQNLKGFKKNFEDELSSLHNNLSNFGHEARPFVYKARDFFGDFFHHLGIFFRGAGKVFVKLAGVVILLTCFGFIVATVVTFIAAIGFGNMHMLPSFPFSVVHDQYVNPILIGCFLVVFIPLLSIIMLTLRGIFNVGSLSTTTGSTVLIIWIAALATVIFYTVKISEGFRETEGFTETISIKPTKNNTYYLKLNHIKYFSHDDSVRLDIKNHFHNMVITDDGDGFNEPRNVRINIEKSDISQPELIESFKAKGANFEDALFNARNTSYVFSQQDSVLKFDYALRKRPNAAWHDEEVTLTLRVPLNYKVVIDDELQNYTGMNVYECKELNKKEHATSAAFIMTENGLECKVDTAVTIKPDTTKTFVKPDSIKVGR